MKHPQVAVIGAGQVGATTAQRLIEKQIADVVLFDIADGLAEGKALDLMQAASIEGHGYSVQGTNNIQEIQGSQIVVLTAGLARKPGMSREDLLQANAKIVKSVSENVRKLTPDAVYIIVTNPLDIMTHLAAKVTQFDNKKVFGMAGILDSARMCLFLAEACGKLPHEISATVLGGHGDLMVPVMSQIKSGQNPIQGLSSEDIRNIIQRTQKGGAEIVSLLKTGSAFYAPASSASLMVQAVIDDSQAVLPVSAFVNGPYGIQNCTSGVCAKLGKYGISEIVEIPLTREEKEALHRSAEKIQKGIQELESLGF